MAKSHVLFCTVVDPTEASPAIVLIFCPDRDRVLFNLFTPARHDPSLVTRPSREPVSLVPDDFADYTSAQLRDYTTALEGDEQLYHRIFAVLDDQGAQDQTVVIHYYHVPPIDPDYPADDPRQMEECIEPDGDLHPKWLVWRIKWEEAYAMTANLDLKPAMKYEVYMNRPERFTDEKGVYDVEAAIKGA
ncbi:hypothetical protein B0A48_17325 [Cryoendolithus antarcticus]|uniref:Uncharacterized protein n=1 Tax=Cryoendolithus antarcticus TaxID=1507870 RepID=A0A1V8SBX6_9PEZI|nr:hypothetical protein B0A48_17325 [Cryoendolithus antarcticus]